MARVTVEDCVLKVPNRFDLVMMAAQRARELASGAPLSIDRDNDKNPVVALREIADETVSLDTLKNSLIKGHQRHVESDEPEEEITELMATDHDRVRGADDSLGDDDALGEGEDLAEGDDALSEMDEEPGEAFEMTGGDVVGRDADDDLGP